jgi:signal transduction histidine kinase
MLDRESFFSFDWDRTPLGPVAGWTRQLRIVTESMLVSKQPLFVLWGSRRTFIFNAAYQRVWDSEELDLLGKPMAEATGPLAWAKLGPMVERVFEGESFLESDFEISREPDGITRYVDFSYTPLQDYDSRKIIAALCICSDVTAKVLAADTNRLEREILALTVENVTEGVALVDRDLSFLLWNEQFLNHFGYDPGEIRMGLNAMELMTKSAARGDLGPGDPLAIVQRLAESIRSTESAQLEIQRSNGTVLNLFRRTIGGGRFLLVSRDVTDERKAARLKDELVSTVSHELRTPLTAISGALTMVAAGAAGELPASAAKLIEIAQRNSERLASLVNDLLDIDKLQSGKVEFNMEEIDLGELVHVSCEQNHPLAEKAGIALRIEVPEVRVLVLADHNRVLQVLANLISNAVKFSPAETTVLVRAERIADHARISVIDEGAGISEEFRARLFDRFTQQDGTASRVQQGTGLGLAISKSIVEAHGGSIQVESAVGRGSTFHVDLPLAGT